MRTPKTLYKTIPTPYTCELETCPRCDEPLVACHYLSGVKVVQTMAEVLTIAYRPKRCADPHCPGQQVAWPSAAWQQIAPWYCTYGYDVIAQIGWQRQSQCAQFADIHQELRARLQISESHVRYLYHHQYLPLLACHERQHLDRLQTVADQTGLMIGLDGLAPEGGEPQLWLVRELHTNLTLRCGWLSMQDHTTFSNFLQPLRDLGLRVAAVMSDKQRGLVPAVAAVFPEAKHAFCQMHSLKNMAAPVAEANETMKVALRKQVREEVGALIRCERATEAPGVLTVTGAVPSPVPVCPGAPPQDTAPSPAELPVAAPDAAAREDIVQDLLRRVRYLLTLKGRPPFRLAGIEMFERLTDVATCLDTLIHHHAEARLVHLRHSLGHALDAVRADYTDLRRAADWLHDIAALLDPDGKPARSGEEVHRELWAYLDRIHDESRDTPPLHAFYTTIRTVSHSYAPGLFHTYDLPDLPRTNNDHESAFRDVTRRLLSTTGQKGWVRHLLQREGAWELIPQPNTLSETVTALAQVDTAALLQERQRVRNHRKRFRLHVRSTKQARAQLDQLQQRWVALPTTSGS
jgi:hypothetical protein